MNNYSFNVEEVLKKKDIKLLTSFLLATPVIKFEDQLVIDEFFNLFEENNITDVSYDGMTYLLKAFYHHVSLDEKIIQSVLCSNNKHYLSLDRKKFCVSNKHLSLKLQYLILNDFYENNPFLHSSFEENQGLKPEIVNSLIQKHIDSKTKIYFLAYREDLTIEQVRNFFKVGVIEIAYDVIKINGELCSDTTLPYEFLLLNNRSFVKKVLAEKLIDVETFNALAKGSLLSLEELMFVSTELSKDL